MWEPSRRSDQHLEEGRSSKGNALSQPQADQKAGRLWNPATGRRVGAPVPTGSMFGAGVAFSPNGKLLASACGDGTVRLWNPATGRRTSSMDDAHGVVGAGPVDPR